jgi:hypothetical protein
MMICVSKGIGLLASGYTLQQNLYIATTGAPMRRRKYLAVRYLLVGLACVVAPAPFTISKTASPRHQPIKANKNATD